MTRRLDRVDISAATKGLDPSDRPVVDVASGSQRFTAAKQREEHIDASLGFKNLNTINLRKSLDNKGLEYKNNDMMIVADALSSNDTDLSNFSNYEYKEGEINTVPGTNIEMTKGAYDLMLSLNKDDDFNKLRTASSKEYMNIKNEDDLFSRHGGNSNIPANIAGSMIGAFTAGLYGSGVANTARNISQNDYIYSRHTSLADVAEPLVDIAAIAFTGGGSKIVTGGFKAVAKELTAESILTASSIGAQSEGISQSAKHVGRILGIEGLEEEARKRTEMSAVFSGAATFGLGAGVYGARAGMRTAKRTILNGAEKLQSGIDAHKAMSTTNIYKNTNNNYIQDKIGVNDLNDKVISQSSPSSLLSPEKTNKTLEVKSIGIEGLVYEHNINVKDIDTGYKWNPNVKYDKNLSNGVVLFRDKEGKMSVLDGNKRISGAKTADGKINGYVLDEGLGVSKKTAQAYSDIHNSIKTGKIKGITKYGFADDVAQKMLTDIKSMDNSLSVYMKLDDNARRYMIMNEKEYDYNKFNEISKLNPEDQLKAMQMYRNGAKNLDGLDKEILEDSMLGYQFFQEGINDISSSYKRMPKGMKKEILAIEEQMLGLRKKNPDLVVSDKDLVDYFLQANYQNNKEFRNGIGKGIKEGRSFIKSYRRGDLPSLLDVDTNTPKQLRNNIAKRGDQAYESSVKYSNVSEIESTVSTGFNDLDIDNGLLKYGDREIDLDSEYKFTDIDGIDRSTTYREAIEDADGDELIRQASVACSVGG